MSVSYWLDDSPGHAPVTVDVVVIGAGISGASTAWWLKDSGLSVAVVDQGGPAAGASGRNAGFVTCGSVEHFSRQVATHGLERALALWRMSQENLELIEEHLVGEGLECDFRRGGTYSLAGSEHEVEVLSKTADDLLELGVRVETVDVAHIERELGARQFHGGVLYLDDGEVHPAKLVRGILERSGAAFHPYHRVFDVTPSPAADSVVVRTDKREFHASACVFATNGYSEALHPWFADKVYPTRGQILVTEPVEPFMAAPCYCNFVLDYFRQLRDGRVLIGGFRQLDKEGEVGTNDRVNVEIHRALLAFLERHFERLEGVRISHRWAGTMGFSQDSLPVIGALPGAPNLFFLGGYTGHGIGWGFKAGQLLARLMTRGEQPPIVSARRFR